jgi:hypothetical protein
MKYLDTLGGLNILLLASTTGDKSSVVGEAVVVLPTPSCGKRARGKTSALSAAISALLITSTIGDKLSARRTPVVVFSQPFIWVNGRMRDLNSLIPTNSGWKLIYANAIDKKGQIVGLGSFNGQNRAFLLTPT